MQSVIIQCYVFLLFGSGMPKKNLSRVKTTAFSFNDATFSMHLFLEMTIYVRHLMTKVFVVFLRESITVLDFQLSGCIEILKCCSVILSFASFPNIQLIQMFPSSCWLVRVAVRESQSLDALFPSLH